MCGDGPFEVDSIDSGQVTLITNVGLARFSEKLFDKVQDDGSFEVQDK